MLLIGPSMYHQVCFCCFGDRGYASSPLTFCLFSGDKRRISTRHGSLQVTIKTNLLTELKHHGFAFLGRIRDPPVVLDWIGLDWIGLDWREKMTCPCFFGGGLDSLID